MNTEFLTKYLEQMQKTINQDDGREESYYGHLKEMLLAFADNNSYKNTDITILPKTTEAGNPDFRVWSGKHKITGYIEAKQPKVNQLDVIETSEQLKRYLKVFPNLILTNFYEFRLYRNGVCVEMVTIASSLNAINLHKAPPLQNVEAFIQLLEKYFSFTLPAITTSKKLAEELAKRTRFLRDEVIAIEIQEENKQGKKVLLEFYESFKKLLINNLTQEQFADLYAQTLAYGIFAARTKATDEFNRELIYKYIPNTLGVLKSIFKFISFGEPPKALEVLIDDIAEVLFVTDIQKILHAYYVEGKGNDPIIHFYETFLSEYDPALREKRGVYYTPEPVVRYIVRSIHSILKTHFNLKDGLADSSVTLLDPAAGTLTFPAEAIKLAVQEHTEKYGSGGVNQMIRNHILPHFYALELMMAPYTVGHLKISYLLDELGYQMQDDERFKLYLSNTLEHDLPPQIELSFAHEISDECKLANDVKQNEPILVIMGNPPYSGMSENSNAWTEKLLKTDIDGAQSYYKVDGEPLGEKNPKMLQDDYVKFLRFAQWKIHKAGRGIVGMVTNHSYIDNATFKGMRQSLQKTFDEIYILDLHGNSVKKEKSPDGSPDENVFDIMQGVAIVLMIKTGINSNDFYHKDLFGNRIYKYDWLSSNAFNYQGYKQIDSIKPFYLFKELTDGNAHYMDWISVKDMFPIHSAGIQTARDSLTIQFNKQQVHNTITMFVNMDVETARLTYKLGKDSQDWSIIQAKKDLVESGVDIENIKPILYRPFDIRFTYYTGKSAGFISRPRFDVMKQMNQENLGLIARRQQIQGNPCNYYFLSDMIISDGVIRSDNKGQESIFPLSIYPDTHTHDLFSSQEKQPNIKPEIMEDLKKQNLTPEDLLYYVYGILFSNIYREKYAEYLALDFPHIPMTKDRELFLKMVEYGKAIAELHLMKSRELDTPIAKYQGSGDNDEILKVEYDEASGRLHINSYKYFEGITPEVWNYHIGGYQVLSKYLKDRKNRRMEDPIHYCRIVTSLSKTIEYQKKIDEIYEGVE